MIGHDELVANARENADRLFAALAAARDAGLSLSEYLRREVEQRTYERRHARRARLRARRPPEWFNPSPRFGLRSPYYLIRRYDQTSLGLTSLADLL